MSPQGGKTSHFRCGRTAVFVIFAFGLSDGVRALRHTEGDERLALLATETDGSSALTEVSAGSNVTALTDVSADGAQEIQRYQFDNKDEKGNNDKDKKKKPENHFKDSKESLKKAKNASAETLKGSEKQLKKVSDELETLREALVVVCKKGLQTKMNYNFAPPAVRVKATLLIAHLGSSEGDLKKIEEFLTKGKAVEKTAGLRKQVAEMTRKKSLQQVFTATLVAPAATEILEDTYKMNGIFTYTLPSTDSGEFNPDAVMEVVRASVTESKTVKAMVKTMAEVKCVTDKDSAGYLHSGPKSWGNAYKDEIKLARDANPARDAAKVQPADMWVDQNERTYKCLQTNSIKSKFGAEYRVECAITEDLCQFSAPYSDPGLGCLQHAETPHELFRVTAWYTAFFMEKETKWSTILVARFNSLTAWFMKAFMKMCQEQKEGGNGDWQFVSATEEGGLQKSERTRWPKTKKWDFEKFDVPTFIENIYEEGEEGAVRDPVVFDDSADDDSADGPPKEPENPEKQVGQETLEVSGNEYLTGRSHAHVISHSTAKFTMKLPAIPKQAEGPYKIIGRGRLGRWGPNLAADMIMTRWNMIEGRYEVGLIKRGRAPFQWAAIGGMVNPGDEVWGTAAKETGEEFLGKFVFTAFVAKPTVVAKPAAENSTGDDAVAKQAADNKTELVAVEGEWRPRGDWSKLQQLLPNLVFSYMLSNEACSKGSKIVYQGLVDDHRNTNNAWMQTTAFWMHCNLCTFDAAPEGGTIAKMADFWKMTKATASAMGMDRIETIDQLCSRVIPFGGDDAQNAAWLSLDDVQAMVDKKDPDSPTLFASHGSFVGPIVEHLRTMRDAMFTEVQAAMR